MVNALVHCDLSAMSRGTQCLALAALRKGELLDNQSYRAATGLDSQVARAELRDLVAREPY